MEESLAGIPATGQSVAVSDRFEFVSSLGLADELYWADLGAGRQG